MKNIIQVEANSDTLIIPAGSDVRVFPVLGIIPDGQSEASLTIPGSPGIIRIPKSGNYRCGGGVSVDSADPGQVRLSIQRESGGAKFGSVGHASALSSVVLQFAAGELVSFRAYNPGEDSVTLQSGPDYNYGLIEFLD